MDKLILHKVTQGSVRWHLCSWIPQCCAALAQECAELSSLQRQDPLHLSSLSHFLAMWNESNSLVIPVNATLFIVLMVVSLHHNSPLIVLYFRPCSVSAALRWRLPHRSPSLYSHLLKQQNLWLMVKGIGTAARLPISYQIKIKPLSLAFSALILSSSNLLSKLLFH